MKTTKRPKNPRFEVYPAVYPMTVPDDSVEWRWRLYARNGEIIASGEGFTRRKDALRAVAAVKRVVAKIVEAE